MINKVIVIRWVFPLAFIIGGYIMGLIFDKYILTKIKSLTANNKWEFDEVVFQSLHKTTILWFVLAGIYGASLNMPLEPKLFNLLQKSLVVVAILSATSVVTRFAIGIVNVYAKKAEGILPSTIFANLTKLLLFILGTMITLQYLGISITPVLTALGVGGLAVALALQDTLSNLFSGIQILASRKIKPGDFIKLESGDQGFVTDITWRNATIQAFPNYLIIVPNAKLSSATIANFSLPEKEMSVVIPIGVSYESDLIKVERVTIAVAEEVIANVQGGLPESEPYIRYNAFADFSINFNIVIGVKEYTDQFLIKHEFIKKLHQRYQHEGIEIPYPIKTVYIKDQ